MSRRELRPIDFRIKTRFQQLQRYSRNRNSDQARCYYHSVPTIRDADTMYNFFISGSTFHYQKVVQKVQSEILNLHMYPCHILA
jgi:hypothetical protein